MIEYLLILSILIFIYYDLRYVKSFPLLALLIAIQVLMIKEHSIWLITFLIVAIVYELYSIFRSKIVEYDDYIHIANSITLLPNYSLESLFIYLILYLILVYISSRFYKNVVPTSAQTYISALAAPVFLAALT